MTSLWIWGSVIAQQKTIQYFQNLQILHLYALPMSKENAWDAEPLSYSHITSKDLWSCFAFINPMHNSTSNVLLALIWEMVLWCSGCITVLSRLLVCKTPLRFIRLCWQKALEFQQNVFSKSRERLRGLSRYRYLTLIPWQSQQPSQAQQQNKGWTAAH